MITYVRESEVRAIQAEHNNRMALKEEEVRKLRDRIVELKQRIKNLGGSL